MSDGASGVSGGDARLAAAAAAAVAASREEWKRLSALTETVIAALGRSGGRRPDGRGAAAGLLDQEDRLTAAVAADLRDMLTGQGRGIGTFNLVLFGRTGAGKSCLIEALTGGSGRSISPGDSDWTTKVQVTEWESCRLYDTPGIAGWGRSEQREVLERRAREAVGLADLVLLCFDSQSQQAEEFRKAAEWIAAYGKPVIAILNSRNALWRNPERLTAPALRTDLSRAVAEHAGNIRTELAAIGLRDVPIVAVHSLRAVHARAGTPYKGPHAHAMKAQRGQYGVARLLEWSNLPTLEELLITAIGTDAVQLRLGALVRHLSGTLALAERRLRVELREPALKLGGPIETGLEQLLGLLGLPEPGTGTGRGLSAAEQRILAEVAELERKRGTRLEVPVEGRAAQHAEHLISARLAPLREAALNRAENLVAEAMEQRRNVMSSEFARRVYDEDAFERVAREIAAEIVDYLNAQASLAVEEVGADIRWQAGGAALDGAAGKRLRWAGLLGGPLSSLVGTGVTAMLTAAALNAWNPAGWVLAAASVVGIAVGVLGKIFSRKARQEAARQRDEALSRSRSEARHAVHAAFESVHANLAEAIIGRLGEELCAQIQPALDQALALRSIAERVQRAERAVAESAATLGAAQDAREILSRAVRTCEAQRGLDGAALWLGASWCADTAFQASAAGGGTGRAKRRVPPGPEPLPSQEFLDAMALPRGATGPAWLAAAEARLTGDTRAAGILRDLRALAAAGRPRVLVCGDYNTGKSSFIRRLLVESGQQIPDTLAVGAAPTTSAPIEYGWNGLTLVDSPGFQSGRDGHTAAARGSIPDAALVIYLFNPNLVVGDQEDLAFVLRGDPERRLPGKLGHTLFAVNRSDELGADPYDDPAGFRRLERRKRIELAQALGKTAHGDSRGPEPPVVREQEIPVLASAPYGLQPATSAEADDFRSWDGFREFALLLERLRPLLEGNAVDVSVLHGGLARFGLLLEGTRSAAADLRDQADQLARLAADSAAQAEAGRLLIAERGAALRTRMDDYLNGLLNAIWSARGEGEHYHAVLKLQTWSSQADFKHVLERWAGETERQTEGWRRATKAVLGRRAASASFSGAFPGIAVPGAASAGGSARHGRSGLSEADLDDIMRVMPSLGEALAGLDADAVMDLGLEFGHVFQLADAADLADVIGGVGLDLFGIGFGWQIFRLTGMLRRERLHDEEQQKTIAELKSGGRRCADLVLEGRSDGVRPTKGVFHAVAAACEALERFAETVTAEAEKALEKAGAYAGNVAVYEELVADAWALLAPEGGRTS